MFRVIVSFVSFQRKKGLALLQLYIDKLDLQGKHTLFRYVSSWRARQNNWDNNLGRKVCLGSVCRPWLASSCAVASGKTELLEEVCGGRDGRAKDKSHPVRPLETFLLPEALLPLSHLSAGPFCYDSIKGWSVDWFEPSTANRSLHKSLSAAHQSLTHELLRDILKHSPWIIT